MPAASPGAVYTLDNAVLGGFGSDSVRLWASA